MNGKIMNKEQIIENLKQLPKPLVGSLAFDHKNNFNLRDACIEMIKEVIEISKPKEILEIGTHLGHSGCLWLSLSEANLTSVDIGTNWVELDYSYLDWGIPSRNGGLKEVERVLTNLFPNRYELIIGDSTKQETIDLFKDKKYDLIFVDGNHAYEYVKKDIETAISLNIPYIHLDDFTGEEAPCRIAAKELGLEFIKEYKDIHNFANISCGFFKNPFYK